MPNTRTYVQRILVYVINFKYVKNVHNKPQIKQKEKDTSNIFKIFNWRSKEHLVESMLIKIH